MPLVVLNSRKMSSDMKIVLVVFMLLVEFIAGYLHSGDVLESVEPEAELRAMPSLRWNGVCPKASKKCPSSFEETTPPLIMISLDGFRPDYMKRGSTPTIDRLAECGTKARFMYPVFPTKTFPNHFSQVTGLYPSSHGIIDNSMYDFETGKFFKVGRNESNEPFWWLKEPIWVTAVKQGKKAACYFWPGSNVKINGTLPTFYKTYHPKVTFEDRVDQVLAWLDLPISSRPDFINLYVNQPDNAGHWYGPLAKETNAAAAKVDRMIERLFSGLQQRNLIDCVNVVITSDHGMTNIDCKRLVEVQKFVNMSNMYFTAGPFGRMRPKGRKDSASLKSIVSKLRCRSPHMRVYPKEQLPVRMHFADNPRIEPIFLDMDSGWTVAGYDVLPGDEICTGGTHGYDNLFPDMRGIFLAHGPSFKKNYSFGPFISTEMYEMLTELMDIKPNPNNGTRGSLHHIMTSPRRLSAQRKPHPPAVGNLPDNKKEYKFRIYASNCSCSQSRKQKTVENQAALDVRHLPFGTPYSPEDNSTLRLLYNEDYISAFDLKYRIPMWTSFTLKEGKNVDRVKDICWKGDARIAMADSPKCTDYSASIVEKQNILPRPLFSPDFSSSSYSEQATYITNAFPASLNFSKILEKPLNQILAKWASQNKELNVVMGPAFDLHATGLRPTIGRIMRLHQQYGPLVVPTHIFVVATWCSSSKIPLMGCEPSTLKTAAFLLPNEPYTNNCESATSVLFKNVARVVDVENLTGLSFYTSLPIYEAIRLRTMMPEISL